MLAQNFKTPDELQVTDAEFAALLQVLGALERDEFRHYTLSRRRLIRATVPNGFSMSEHLCKEGCNTVACIAGWAHEFSGGKVFKSNGGIQGAFLWGGVLSHALEELFYMYTQPPGALDTTTPKQAARALRNFLTYGEARWDEALAE